MWLPYHHLHGTTKYEGQNTLQYDWTKWTATGSDVETSDGGGYASLFSEDRTKYWHSQYSDGGAPLPHWLVIDMKEELECISFAIGRRAYGENNYGSVKNWNCGLAQTMRIS